MKDDERTKPGQEKENYAEHLARVIPDADHSKALLQAQYKTLHTATSADSTSESDSPPNNHK